MKNVKNPLYIPADLEIITFECNDIITASGGTGGSGNNGWTSDDGEMSDW